MSQHEETRSLVVEVQGQLPIPGLGEVGRGEGVVAKWMTYLEVHVGCGRGPDGSRDARESDAAGARRRH